MTVKGALSLTNNQYQEAVKKAVRPKFRGNRPLPAKTIPQYPQSAEREYRRIAGAYMRLLNEELKKKLPAMMNEYKRERHGDSRLDDSRDLDARIRQMLQEVSAALEKRISQFGLDSKIQQIAKMTRNTSVREWKRAVKDTLGIDILDDYYSGELYEQAIQRWIAENVAYIKSLPTETLGNMRQIILDGYLNGRPIRDIQKDIQAPRSAFGPRPACDAERTDHEDAANRRRLQEVSVVYVPRFSRPPVPCGAEREDLRLERPA